MIANASAPSPAQETPLWRAYADTLRPAERLTPSQFSEKHIVLDPGEAPEQPGPWRNDYFPYLKPVMDSVPEAIAKGKQGWVLMKSAQGGGSRAVQNVIAWMLSGHYAGAVAYMTSKDDVARAFSIERFQPMINTCTPLSRKYLARGSATFRKRFTDSSIAMTGPAITNLQSQPYRFFVWDEVDSLAEKLEDGSDPIKLALQRMKSFFGPTLLLALAHPSSRERGSAKLFYSLSDQRRGFVTCPHCAGEFWLQWAHVKAVAKEGMNQQQAELDPGCYEYHCPECSCEISDAQRYSMVLNVKYRSELPPEEAASRPWIGVHFSQLYQANHSLRKLATEYCSCKTEAEKLTFHNKVLGEPYETKIESIEMSHWQRVIATPSIGKHMYRGVELAHDPEAYSRGQVPPGVRFLTAGQDSRHAEFHYSVWGWGLRRIADMNPPGNVRLCGWLIEWGKLPRATPGMVFSESEYHVFDDLLFRRLFPTTYSDDTFHVVQALFDTGYQPTQIPIHAYCRWFPGRAVAVKGGAYKDSSRDRGMPVKWGSPLKFKLGDLEVKDDSSKLLIVNTYLIKLELYGSLLRQFKTQTCHGLDNVHQIHLPMDADADLLKELSAEYLTTNEDGDKVWAHKGPNHFADTATYAMAAALNLDPFQEGLPFEEVQAREKQEAEQKERDRAAARSKGDRSVHVPKVRTKY